jgi:uncharacterized protein
LKKFECQPDCGNCCRIPQGKSGGIRLLKKDVERLSVRFAISEYEFNQKYCTVINGMLHLKVDKQCIFLDGSKCSIHDSRPTQCRTFPFWRGNLVNSVWEELKKDCPGIGKGRNYSHDEIMEKVKLSDKLGKLVLPSQNLPVV